jgi:hypothetical protein
MGRFVNLHEDVLRDVLRFGEITNGSRDKVDDRLLVFLHQSLESRAIAITHAAWGGILIEVG